MPKQEIELLLKKINKNKSKNKNKKLKIKQKQKIKNKKKTIFSKSCISETSPKYG